MTAKFAVADDRHRSIMKKIRRLLELLDLEGGCPNDPEKIEGALQAINEGKFAEALEAPVPVIKLASRLIHGMFVPPAEQVDNVRKWNKRRKWGFSEEQLSQALATAPAWPVYQLCVAVLVPYLSTVGQTFEELWDIVFRKQHDRYRYEGLRSEPEKLRLLELETGKIGHTPGLRWEVIDLAANWDKKDGIAPAMVRDLKSSPHAGVLAAAAHFPKWVRKIDGVNVPFVWIPGYQASIPDDRPWTRVPILLFDRAGRRVRLRANDESRRRSLYAVPAFRE